MVVLKGIPSVLSPELLYALARMGHGDEIVLADANFPSSSISKAGPELIQADDTYVETPASVMDLVQGDKERGLQITVWEEYKELLSRYGCKAPLEKVERFAFYERAKKAFAVVATGETSPYGNLILKKGVISQADLV
ncbi:hypothetical protein GDO86_013048 [Hymenochirus boettgeri]|uniref:L-fucose mutarotase n=1 Tax=Hymenochirus boettgeri TaxID=247094 RepID=A0A8T2IXS1_9PIPI|nr:hypothetical protein GDO86_013048 [Hymenochirus boettgeri]KAG8434936.1 hypothetical protein GDO86_013048 [Hymenochirus boettgeri]